MKPNVSYTCLSKNGFTQPRYGVVKVCGIPWKASPDEIIDLILRYVPAKDLQIITNWPVHMISAKPTGLTADHCFVELLSSEAAISCVETFSDLHSGDSCYPGTVQLQHRHVRLECSNQTELMKAIFPRCQSVSFDSYTGAPILSQPLSKSTFKGYLLPEELYGLTNTTIHPERFRTLRDNYARPYQSMISLLYKYPWYDTDTYTLHNRDSIFIAARKQIQVLRNIISKGHPTTRSFRHIHHASSKGASLSPALLENLVRAALSVPAFSILQQKALLQSAGPFVTNRVRNVFIDCWPFQTLRPNSRRSSEETKDWLHLFGTGVHIAEEFDLVVPWQTAIVVSHNRLDLPIAEWTCHGTNLTFAQGTKAEQHALSYLLALGREAWNWSRSSFSPDAKGKLPSSPAWSLRSLSMSDMYVEKVTNGSLVRKQEENRRYSEDVGIIGQGWPKKQ